MTVPRHNRMTSLLDRVLGLELTGILVLLGLAVLLQFLTGRIRLRGLLREKHVPHRLSWTRLQLLAVTLVTAGYLARAIWTAPAGRVPAIPWFWIYLMGASSALYLVCEAFGCALSKTR